MMSTKTVNPDSDEYIGYVEGYIATSSADTHGDRIPPELIQKMAEKLEADSNLQIMTLNHDPTQKTGRILNMRVDKKPDWAGLWVRVGVFKTRPDVWEMFETGQLRGFSVTVGVSDYKGKLPVDTAGFDCQFQVVVPGLIWHEVDDLLRSSDCETYPIVRKGLPAETTIYVAGSVASLGSVILSLVTFLKSRRTEHQSERDEVEVSVVVEEEKLTLSANTAERIIRRITMSAKKERHTERE